MIEASSSESFNDLMDGVAKAFEVLGAAILVIGAVWAVVMAVAAWRRSGRGNDGYVTLRRVFGSALLLGLEVLVAADLIRTVAVSPTLDNVLSLGLIVLIRTFLSFSLQIEIEGRLPWKRPAAAATGRSPSDTTSSPGVYGDDAEPPA